MLSFGLAGFGAAFSADEEKIISTLAVITGRPKAEELVLAMRGSVGSAAKKGVMPIVIGAGAVGAVALVMSIVALVRSRRK